MQRIFIKLKNKLAGILTLIVIIILFIITCLLSAEWVKYHSVRVTSYDSKNIDVMREPVQKLYKYEIAKSKIFKYKSLKKNITAKIKPVAYYKISGLVIAHNTYFPEKDGFDYIALYDIGIVWNKLAKNDFYKNNCKAKSEQVIIDGLFPHMGNGRVLNAWCINHDETLKKIGYNWLDFDNHVSHTHIIPANRNIIAALNTIKNYDVVEIEGELVNVEVDGEFQERISSLERTDDNGSALGGGACEIMYVTKVKIGHNVYQ